MVYYRGWRIRETLLKVSAYLSAFPVKRSKGIEKRAWLGYREVVEDKNYIEYELVLKRNKVGMGG